MILKFILRFLPFFRIGGVALTLMAAVLYIRHGGVVAERNKQNELAIAGVKKHEKIADAVTALSDAELDKRLHKYDRD